jgi:carboxyl-terminal processing protease
VHIKHIHKLSLKLFKRGVFPVWRVTVCLFFASSALAQVKEVNPLQREAILLRSSLEKNHYSPRVLDDKFSKQVFFRLVNLLDPHHLYFTASDLKALSAYKLQIDNELNGNSWKFLSAITDLYKQRLLISEKTFSEILQKPFDFSGDQKINFSTEDDSLVFAHDEKDYTTRWVRWLKYETLLQLVSLQMKADTGKTEAPFPFAKEAEMRQKVLKLEKRDIKRMLDHPSGFENYVASLFFNAITSCYDAHSSYFSKTDWQNFQSGLSSESYSFGMDIDENETGDIVIERLVPGGPAWKSNELHKGDVLLELRWTGKNSMDLAGAEIQEVEAMFEASNSEKMEITVKKMNGQVKTIALLKEKIRDDENIVKSFILSGEKKIGYISLPGFYTEWENALGKGCSNDVAKEIMKLKAEKIDGLILDIRDNGGGALVEGLNLAGIFINEGPLFMMQKRDLKPVVWKDMNRGTVYDGPMAVMVNGQSASASELLASTLQDYNRAVIIGSRTFGKATGQATLALDTNVKDLSELKSAFGIAAVTVEKLYRVTGKSAQLNGVKPDIHLPDIYESLDYYEDAIPFALPSDVLNKKVLYSPLAPLPLNELSKESAKRIESIGSFQIIKKMVADSALSRRKNIVFSLNPTSISKVIKDKYAWYEALEDAGNRDIEIFKVDNVGYDKDLIKMDTYGQEINNIIIKNLQTDIYVEETFQILNNLINLTKH